MWLANARQTTEDVFQKDSAKTKLRKKKNTEAALQGDYTQYHAQGVIEPAFYSAPLVYWQQCPTVL